jgi:hypothetical protein
MGEGLVEVTLACKGLDHARKVLAASGLSAEPSQDDEGGLLLPVDAVLGARLRLLT